MKRTRRIQITRYRRRVTATQSELTAAEIAEERPEGDLIVNVLRSIPPMSEKGETNALVLRDVESEYSPRRRSLLRLAKLLRRRK